MSFCRLFVSTSMKIVQGKLYDKSLFCRVFTATNRHYSDSQDDKIHSEKIQIYHQNIRNDEWRKRLSAEEYHVTREKGTEPPFSGKYYNHWDEGLYKCICCSSDLFRSSEKFESHCGWPSFYSPIQSKLKNGSNPVKVKADLSHGMVRTEVLCAQCDAHLGHVFDDGPKPTGLRYCINSVALTFIPKKE